MGLHLAAKGTECEKLACKVELLGTIHHDPNGFWKTMCLLKTREPDLIFIELSPFGYRFRKKHKGILKKILSKNLKIAAHSLGIPYRTARLHPEIRKISQQIALPFEYRAAKAYSKKRKIPLFLADSSQFSREWIRYWPQLLSAKNLRCLLSIPAAAKWDESKYASASMLINGQSKTAYSLGFIGMDEESRGRWEAREHYMARKIAVVLSIYQPHKPIYIGGWEHLVPERTPRSLRDILGLDMTQCHLLHS